GYGGLAPPPDPAAYAPTGHCARRRRALRGEVHDANAWALGGAAGHAGVFATVDEVGRWALDLLRASQGHAASLDGGVVRTFWDPAWRAPDATWVLAWDTPSPGGQSTGGARISAAAIGHLGFTGTSVWIDRDADLVTVLLTNRVALGPASGPRMRLYRPHFHDAVRDAL
ncbi:MAG: serine hydrolase, partial [Deltaproteobacteria bacterium]